MSACLAVDREAFGVRCQGRFACRVDKLDNPLTLACGQVLPNPITKAASSPI